MAQKVVALRVRPMGQDLSVYARLIAIRTPHPTTLIPQTLSTV